MPEANIEEIALMWSELHDVTRVMFKAFYNREDYNMPRDMENVDKAIKGYFFNKKIEEIVNE